MIDIIKILSRLSEDSTFLDKVNSFGKFYKGMNGYDKLFSDVRIHSKRYCRMVDLLKETNRTEFSSCLEIGCNTGVLSMHVKSAFPETEVIATDISERQIKMNKFFESFFKNGVEFENFSGQDMPHSMRNRFDLVFLCEILEHLEPESGIQRRVLEEAINSLTEQGLLIITVPYEDRIPSPGHLTEFSSQSLTKLIAKCTDNFIELDEMREKLNLQKHLIFLAAKPKHLAHFLL